MPTWHLLGTRAELEGRVPFAVKLDRHAIAVFLHEGRLRAIGNGCNHKGGPLCEGRLRGEFVMCPWHGWEYSVVTGKGPEGYDEEQVPVFEVEERPDGVYVATPPAMPRKLVKHKPAHLLEAHPKPAGAPPRVLAISTTAMDDANPRYSTSDALLEHALRHAAEVRHADTRLIKLRELAFRHCEGNYSKAARACTWPCAITERDPDDQLTPVYEGLVHWADVVLVATPIRWGNASSLYYKMIERLNCVQNQITIHNNMLIANKAAAFIITGGQDNIQGVAGSMLTFWSELGFVFPPYPFIAHSRGWDAEDMENNVRLVKASDMLRIAAQELVERALDFWTILDHHKAELARPMERAGRKANALMPREEAVV
ncbi:MAG TPA: Rieske 2Fe-2S domain-containing protein [Gemmatimonadales bacterium]|nr:Rieske 2Fe-2S domain-containing protein [Gemmatimonadales bacterium]